MIDKTPGHLPSKIAKIGAIALLVYVAVFAVYAFTHYGLTKSKLLSLGISDATASLLGVAVMLIAIAVPIGAGIRILFMRGKTIDYAAMMVLPLISWGIAQIPAKFNQDGSVRQYCSVRPDGEKFCLDRPGIDPITGAVLVAETPESAVVEYRQEKGMRPVQISRPLDQIEYFDGITGKPKVWVLPGTDGCFVAFNNPGLDPATGQQLVPITAALVSGMHECLRSREAEKQRAVDSKRESERLARLSAEAEARAKAQAAERSRQEQEMQAKELALREWQGFEDKIATSPSAAWNPNPMWRDHLNGQRINIRYSAARAADAIEIAKRLKSLGSQVSHQKASDFSGGPASQVHYAFATYDAATSIRSSAMPIARLELISSDSGSSEITVSLN